jgi:hypothetical protein
MTVAMSTALAPGRSPIQFETEQIARIYGMWARAKFPFGHIPG